MDDNQNNTLPLSIPAWLLSHAGTALIRRGLNPDWPLARRRQWQEQLARLCCRMPKTVDVREDRVGTVPGRWLTPPDLGDTGRTVLYLHGGGYTLGSSNTHLGLCAHLAAAAQARVFVADYRLAPEHPFPAALEDAVAVAQALYESGLRQKSLVLAGDSAGGGLALSTALALRDLGLPRPAALLLLSPWLDLLLGGDSVQSHQQREKVLPLVWLQQCAEQYAGDDLSQPLASPLHAELDRLPPTLIQVGSEELLLDDARRLAEELAAHGIEQELQIGTDLWHVWPLLAGWMPEAGQALREAGAFVRRHSS